MRGPRRRWASSSRARSWVARIGSFSDQGDQAPRSRRGTYVRLSSLREIDFLEGHGPRGRLRGPIELARPTGFEPATTLPRYTGVCHRYGRIRGRRTAESMVTSLSSAGAAVRSVYAVRSICFGGHAPKVHGISPRPSRRAAMDSGEGLARRTSL